MILSLLSGSIRSMHPDTLLSVALDAVCARHQYERDAGAAVAELRQAAGGRMDLLHESVGTWVGYFDAPETHALCTGLLDAFPEAQAWVHVGQERRGRLHGTGEYR